MIHSSMSDEAVYRDQKESGGFARATCSFETRFKNTASRIKGKAEFGGGIIVSPA